MHNTLQNYLEAKWKGDDTAQAEKELLGAPRPPLFPSCLLLTLYPTHCSTESRS